MCVGGDTLESFEVYLFYLASITPFPHAGFDRDSDPDISENTNMIFSSIFLDWINPNAHPKYMANETLCSRYCNIFSLTFCHYKVNRRSIQCGPVPKHASYLKVLVQLRIQYIKTSTWTLISMYEIGTTMCFIPVL